jgi:hypothetical protein
MTAWGHERGFGLLSEWLLKERQRTDAVRLEKSLSGG